MTTKFGHLHLKKNITGKTFCEKFTLYIYTYFFYKKLVYKKPTSRASKF